MQPPQLQQVKSGYDSSVSRAGHGRTARPPDRPQTQDRCKCNLLKHLKHDRLQTFSMLHRVEYWRPFSAEGCLEALGLGNLYSTCHFAKAWDILQPNSINNKPVSVAAAAFREQVGRSSVLQDAGHRHVHTNMPRATGQQHAIHTLLPRTSRLHTHHLLQKPGAKIY